MHALSTHFKMLKENEAQFLCLYWHRPLIIKEQCSTTGIFISGFTFSWWGPFWKQNQTPVVHTDRFHQDFNEPYLKKTKKHKTTPPPPLFDTHYKNSFFRLKFPEVFVLFEYLKVLSKKFNVYLWQIILQWSMDGWTQGQKGIELMNCSLLLHLHFRTHIQMCKHIPLL